MVLMTREGVQTRLLEGSTYLGAESANMYEQHTQVHLLAADGFIRRSILHWDVL